MPRCAWLLLAALAAGCGGGDDDVDFTGQYSINLTSRENGCELDNWTEDQTASNITVGVAQSGDDITATIEGVIGDAVRIWLGSNVFHGGADGADLEMTLNGSRELMEGGCVWTINATVVARLSGDVLRGDILYTTETNLHADCGDKEDCLSRQEFNGARPPQ